ncbi:MAG: type II secretion system inner membrane protein GspF [Desulfatibacillaceae bacterium]
MPVYEYTVLDAKGRKRSGIVDADSAYAARQKLRDDGTFPTEVRETRSGGQRKETRRFDLSRSIGSGVRASQVAVMTRQLATLVGAGLPLVRAMETLVPQIPNPTLKRVMAEVKDAIVEGTSFAEALARHPRIFPPIFINMVRAGEASGALEVVMENLADLFESQEAAKSRIQSAMVYPILMIFLSIAVMAILMIFVVPKITSIFEDVDQALPAITVVVIGFSTFVQHYWWAMLLGFVVLMFGLRRIGRTTRGRWLYDRLKLEAPIFGPLATKLATARFGHTLSSLLANGVTLMSALDITRSVVQNVVIQDALEEATEEVSEGRSLAAALGRKDVFPPVAIQMIDVGEHSGELEKMLEKAADMYQNEAESTINGLTSLLEPLLILVMGVVVGVIVISILLPIFEMSQLAG